MTGEVTSGVHVAVSYEEAKRMELAAERFSIRLLLLRGFLQIWLAVSNIAMATLKALLFRTGVPRPEEVHNIVVYTVGTLGDNVLMLPAIAGIRRHYPHARLVSIVNCDGFSEFPAREILGHSPDIDALITLTQQPVRRSGWGLHVVLPAEKKPACDLFVNLSPFGNRGWIGAVIREMAFARWLGAKWAEGFRMQTYARRGIFNRVQHRFVENEARRPRWILRRLGASTVENEDLLPADPAAKGRIAQLLGFPSTSGKKIVVLTPGAKLRASRWPAEQFGAVARWLAENQETIVFVNGTRDEAEVCDAVVAFSGGVARSLAGALSLLELIELLRQAHLCVTNSTGPMTLSAMIRTPTVVLASTRFSPTFYIPISDRMITLFRFDENSYDYNDSGDTARDLLGIVSKDVIGAVEDLFASAVPRKEAG